MQEKLGSQVPAVEKSIFSPGSAKKLLLAGLASLGVMTAGCGQNRSIDFSDSPEWNAVYLKQTKQAASNKTDFIQPQTLPTNQEGDVCSIDDGAEFVGTVLEGTEDENVSKIYSEFSKLRNESGSTRLPQPSEFMEENIRTLRGWPVTSQELIFDTNTPTGESFRSRGIFVVTVLECRDLFLKPVTGITRDRSILDYLFKDQK